MKSWIAISLGLLASWYFIDPESGSVFQCKISPALVGIFLMLLMIKVALLIGPDSGRGGGGGSGGDGGGYSGSDGGC